MIYAAYHLLPRASAHWMWSTRLGQWYNSKYPRPHTIQKTRNIRVYHLLLITVFLLSSFDLLFKTPVPAFWEDLLPIGQFCTIYVAAVIIVIGISWWIVLCNKLRRQGGKFILVRLYCISLNEGTFEQVLLIRSRPILDPANLL
jgi:hypothetical protein